MNPSPSDLPILLGGPAIELGPHLPMPAYHAMERWHPERIGALALYCSDGRWGEAFDEFCHRRLFIPRYDRWAVPGVAERNVRRKGGEVAWPITDRFS